MVQMNVVADVDVAAHVGNAPVEIRFVSFLCANEGTVGCLDGAVQAGEKVVFGLMIWGRS